MRIAPVPSGPGPLGMDQKQGSAKSVVGDMAIKSGPVGSILPLVGVLLAVVVAALDKAVATVAMPRAVAELNGFSRYSWTSAAELIASTIAMLVFAKLSDLYGRKPLYLVGTLFLLVGSLFCAAAGNLPVPF